jgi:hypothetical protein
MYRNAQVPLVGSPGQWKFGGNCITAQCIVFPFPFFQTLQFTYARWRVCWDPNISNGNQTGVGLYWGYDASPFLPPNYITSLTATGAGQVRNDAFDITSYLQSTLATATKEFNIATLTAGDGVNAAHIYSSALEIW